MNANVSPSCTFVIYGMCHWQQKIQSILRLYSVNDRKKSIFRFPRLSGSNEHIHCMSTTAHSLSYQTFCWNIVALQIPDGLCYFPVYSENFLQYFTYNKQGQFVGGADLEYTGKLKKFFCESFCDGVINGLLRKIKRVVVNSNTFWYLKSLNAKRKIINKPMARSQYKNSSLTCQKSMTYYIR